MRAIAFGSMLATVFAMAGCGGQSPPPAAPAAAAPAPLATNRQIMLGLVIPAADVVWSAATQEPADDAAWEKIQANAAMIAEAGALMTMPPRVVDQAEWMTQVKALIATSTAAAQGAAEKNIDKLMDGGNTMYEVCDACHKKYMPARQGEDAAPQPAA